VHRLKGTWLHDVLGAWTLVWSYAPILAALAVFARWPSALTFAGAFLMVVIRQNALFVVAHECFHGTLFRRRGVNAWVGAWLAASPIVLPYAQSRRLHLEHHRRVGEHDDPSRYAWDFPVTERSRWLRYFGGVLTAVPFVVRAVTMVLGRGGAPAAARPGLEDGGSSKADLLRVVVVHLVLLGAFTLTLGPLWYFLLWLLPSIGAHLVLDDLRQFLEHREGQLVIYRAGPIERFVFGPFNFHLHAFHHAIASEPWFCVPSSEERARRKAPHIHTLGSYTVEIVRYLRGRGLRDVTGGAEGAAAGSTIDPSPR
jgi:fatty acid desaturase